MTKFRVWGIYPGLLDEWIAISAPFETENQAREWAKHANADTRIEEEDHE